MQGVFVSGVTALDDGTLFASTRGVGMARSDDGGFKWTWVNDGLAHHEFWSCRAGKLQGRDVVFAGALPAHLYVSEDKGKSWRELKAFRDAKTVKQWTFPPPPRIGHIKDIVLDGDRLWVGVEIGSLQVSNDFGQSFTELPVDPDPQECDIHRILVHPARPDRIIIANGIVGMMSSEDGGKSFQRMKMPAEANYPDAIVIHPDQPDLLFMSAGVGWPVHWYELGRARGKIFRSRDAGKTWERLLGGLPNGQRALFSGLTIEARQVAIRSTRSTPTVRCSRASTAATPGRSSPTCRRCRRPISTRGSSATASSSPTSTTSSPIRPPPSAGRRPARRCEQRPCVWPLRESSPPAREARVSATGWGNTVVC